MSLTIDINELKQQVESFVHSGKDDKFIISKLEEKYVNKKQLDELMLYACHCRIQRDYDESQEQHRQKWLTKSMLILWSSVIAIVVIVMLITKNDNSIIGGAILAFSLHQIISEGIKYSRY